MDASFDVRPDVGIFSVISHLPYKPQYALAEYIDNAISSWENNKAALEKINPDYKLVIEIEIGGDRISIKDNAAGISKKDYARAFKPAELPPNRSGLNEFGMGMKAASIWFCKNWKVVTNSIYDDATGVIEFNVDEMIKSKSGVITPKFLPKRNKSLHGTEIILTNLNKKINGQHVRRIKEHLEDIYRFYIRSNSVIIKIFDEGEDSNDQNSKLTFEEMPALIAEGKYPKGPKTKVKWEKSIEVDLPGGRKISGFARVLAKASTSRAGLYLFRRNRIILGATEPYRPYEIFGRSNSFTYQRVYGELTMKGFAVDHMKGSFIWGPEEEELVINKIKAALTDGELDLLAQAESHRVGNGLEDANKSGQVMDKSNNAVEGDIRINVNQLSEVTESKEEIYKPQKPQTALDINIFKIKKFSVPISGENWIFTIEAIRGGNLVPLFESEATRDDKESTVSCMIRLNLDDRFACNYLNRDADFYDIILRFAVATSYAQAQSKLCGNNYTGVMVRNITKTLSSVLSGNL
jgi:hypothetical protein